MLSDNEIVKIYDSLSHADKLVLQCLALAVEPMSETAAVIFVGGLKLQPLLRPQKKTIKKSLQNLFGKGLLQLQLGKYECPTEVIAVTLYDIGIKEKLIQKVKRELAFFSPAMLFVHRNEESQIFTHGLRNINFALLSREQSELEKVTIQIRYVLSDKLLQTDWLLKIAGQPLKPKRLKQFPPEFFQWLFDVYAFPALFDLKESHVISDLKKMGVIQSDNPLVTEYFVTLYFLQGKKNAFDKTIESLMPEEQWAWRGTWEAACGNYPKAREILNESRKTFRKNLQKNTLQLADFHGLMHALAFQKVGTQREVNGLQKMINKLIKTTEVFSYAYESLNTALMMQANSTVAAEKRAKGDDLANIPPLFHLFKGWEMVWSNTKVPHHILQLEKTLQKALTNNFHWIALELASALNHLKPTKNITDILNKLQQTSDFVSQINVFAVKSRWERSLLALKALPTSSTKPANQEKRIIWLVDMKEKEIQPKEQKVTKSGKWTKGRNISLKRLKESPPTFLTPHDLPVLEAIETESWGGYYSSPSIFIDFEKAIVKLAGHPLVFDYSKPKLPIELVKTMPELKVKKEKNQFILQLSPKVPDSNTVIIEKETSTRYKVTEITEKHIEIKSRMGGNHLKIPAEGKNVLLDAVGHLASEITIHSEIEEAADNYITVEASSQAHVHLRPMGNGFQLELLVKPVPQSNYFKPGEGAISIITRDNAQVYRAERRLKEEISRAEQVIENCPSLHGYHYTDEVFFDTPDDCLNILDELQQLNDCVIEWPEGEKLKLAYQVTPNQFSLSLKKHNDWFEMDGTLEFDDQTVMNMRQLLDLVQDNSSRFIQMDDGRFMALTKTFKRRLEMLNAIVEKSKKQMKAHPLAALALRDFASEFPNLQGDKHWNEMVEKIEHANASKPRVPSTLQAELRDYQHEGYRWMRRLAEWGAGACLADDMGLGKTIQALAVLLHRAKEGPSLVIAPASVCSNWERETVRFAPSLNPIQLGANEREAQVKNAAKFDLVVCSYGLLPHLNGLLESREWTTVVLDEAQAIKNTATKRSKAVMKINAGFKIITTGTPVENHLGELWNLFNFINPGLLGNIKQFNERFGIPISKFGDKNAQQKLKALTRPFILRRRKSQVLEELPKKTEITLQVTLEQEEAALYEAVRQKAVESIENMNEDNGQKRFQILAQITKLRRLACHPQLIFPNSKVPASKLKLFEEVLDSLLENKHKVLVFSQFVTYLAIIRQLLDSKKIKYQYLDGSTPKAKRQQHVDAFQAGEGEVFLISLKAGGLGLNLTAADYVIHMDPWWNPAVEDQASDRAHRIGQTRPVTIYRLVTKGTIEEKIIALHQSKRDLADGLLEGTDSAVKLSAEEMFALIQDS